MPAEPGNRTMHHDPHDTIWIVHGIHVDANLMGISLMVFLFTIYLIIKGKLGNRDGSTTDIETEPISFTLGIIMLIIIFIALGILSVK